MSNFKFGVLGAGVVGLTTALELQNQFPTSDVIIVAENFNQETTSDGAAGIFRPGTSFSAFSEEATKFIIKESYNYYEDIRRSFQPFATGVTQISGYIFSKNDPSLVENELIDKIVPLYRPATQKELKICPGNWKYGSYFTTILTECRRFLPWCLERILSVRHRSFAHLELLTSFEKFLNYKIFLKVKLRFQANSGKVIQKKIKSLNDFENYNFDMIFNCSGFGAKNLFRDRKLVPIRGQVIKVSAPWLKNFYYADYDTYIIPGMSSVTLGGCRNYDSYELIASPYDSASIWDRCTELIPRLKTCSIDREWVGLRPHRDPVRIEAEIIKTNSKILKCIHNYGHGGYGVMTAPGTAKLAVKIGINYIKGVHKL